MKEGQMNLMVIFVELDVFIIPQIMNANMFVLEIILMKVGYVFILKKIIIMKNLRLTVI
jgi:hypothetical protein